MLKRALYFLGSLLILLPGLALANLRAPWHISPYPSFAIIAKAANLTVLGETLEFACDSLYLGDANAAKLQSAACRVTAVYHVRSEGALDAGLEFIGPSAAGISMNVNGKPAVPNVVRLTFTRDEAMRFGVFHACRFCPHTGNADEPEQPLYSIKFNGAFQAGANTIVVKYTQPLALDEISYGYFQTSKWAQGFTYELWPLREWKLDPGFQLKLSISTPRPGFFKRLTSKTPLWECQGYFMSGKLTLPLPGKGQGMLNPEDFKKEPVVLTVSHT
ncbi:MAG: hypothetical protein HY042_10190, partial [Spirochaetia bacterium]|nr:hypothetical protein [Spirochaetia bacterium]